MPYTARWLTSSLAVGALALLAADAVALDDTASTTLTFFENEACSVDPNPATVALTGPAGDTDFGIDVDCNIEFNLLFGSSNLLLQEAVEFDSASFTNFINIVGVAPPFASFALATVPGVTGEGSNRTFQAQTVTSAPVSVTTNIAAGKSLVGGNYIGSVTTTIVFDDITSN